MRCIDTACKNGNEAILGLLLLEGANDGVVEYVTKPAERSLARSEATSRSNTRRGNHTAYSITP